MDVPIETAKQKIPTKRQTCNTKDQTVMKRNRNNTRQSVSYYRRPYKNKNKTEKKTKNYRSECLREALSQEKLPSNINVP